MTKLSAGILAISSLILSLLAFPAYSANDDAMSARVKADLEDAVSKIVPRDSFIVHVFTETETVSEKRISEGEVFTQSNPTAEIKVPPLPGFQVAPPKAIEPPAGQTRQVYKMVDKEILKSLRAQVDFDQALSPEVVTQAKDFIRRYLDMSFGAKASYRFGSIRMLPAASPASRNTMTDKALEYLPWIVGLAGFLLVFSWMLRKQPQPRPPVLYPEVMSRAEEGEVSNSRSSDRIIESGEGRSQRKPMALPSGKFPALPATVDFIDRRTELLQSFLQYSEIFRMYYSKLAEAAQMELYTGLRGPAFDSLLESLGLTHPQGNENAPPPSEEQMLFYQKNFQEFIATNTWQNSQFFGFLKQLTLEQLSTLVRQENPVVGALILKFCSPGDSAAILSSLDSSTRTEILTQFSRTRNFSTDELSSVEASVREKVAKLPRLLLGYNQEDETYWAKVLSLSEKQEEILLDLERSRPELYPALAKFRFKLEDMPSLPTPLVHKVLDEVDNEELALALLKCPKSIVEFALAELTPDRSKLISSHLGMYEGMPTEKVQRARQNVTLKFREVMA